MKKNRVTELLRIKYPVIQAAMAWITDANLAAAVCNAGGMGVLGPNAGVRVPEHDPLQMAENLRHEIQKLRGMTDGSFAVNYIIPMANSDPTLVYSDQVKRIILEEKVEFVLAIGEMNEFVEKEIAELTAAGCKVIYREVSCTLDACKRSVKAGAKAIIVTGFEGGGHISKYPTGLISILPQVTAAIQDVPVIAAGGIVDGIGSKVAKVMGAEAVYCGTAFMLSGENPMHKNCRKALIETTAEDLIIWKGSVACMRSTNNALGKRCLEMDRSGASRQEIGMQYTGTFNISMLDGDVENGCVTCSSSIGALHAVQPAGEIVERIAQGFAD